MLPSANELKSKIVALSPTTDATAGGMAFANVIGDFTNKIQAGPTGSPGIVTFSVSVMAPLLAAMKPVSDNSWTSSFSNAWKTAMEASLITPGTVINPIWIGSGGSDIATLPSAAATIISLSAAAELMTSGLLEVASASDQPLQLAIAIYNATASLTFLCIGLSSPPTFIPVPLPISGL